MTGLPRLLLAKKTITSAERIESNVTPVALSPEACCRGPCGSVSRQSNGASESLSFVFGGSREDRTAFSFTHAFSRHSRAYWVPGAVINLSTYWVPESGAEHAKVDTPSCPPGLGV